MSFIEDDRNIYEEEIICPYCDKKFYYEEQPQMVGFRQKDELICPWCKKECKSSMSVDYFNIRKEK